MNLTKPTILASFSYLILPFLFLILGWLEIKSPEWDANDSGAVQGFIFFVLASISGFICVAATFPIVALKLKDNFTPRKWIYLNITCVVFVSYMASIIFLISAGDYLSSVILNALLLTLILTVVGLIFLAPAMFVWLYAIKSSHNKAL